MNFKRSHVAAMVLIASASCLPPAFAEGAFYLGAGWGQTTFNHGRSAFDDGSLASGRVDDNDSGWKLFAGYRFARHLAVEAGYALLNNDVDSQTTFFDGVSDGSGTSFAEGGVSVDLHRPQAVFATAVGILPIGKRFALRGKVGLHAWTTEVTTFDSAGVRGEDETGTDPVVGVGTELRVSKRLALRAEWERFTGIAGDDVDLVSLGASFGFGQH